MTSLHFILRGLNHHRTGYLGVLLGSALGTMVLLGALFAGDSVKSTLRTIAEQRTGQTQQILAGGENLFRSQLAGELNDTAAPVLQLRAQVNETGGRSTGQVDLFGIDPRFWSFAPAAAPWHDRPGREPQLTKSEWAINRQLADTLDLETGQSIILRLRKPGLIAGDAPLAESTDELITLRGTVSRVLDDTEMGRFSLEATQLTAPKVFLPIDTLADAIEHPGRANLILFKGTSPDQLRTELQNQLQLADYGLSIQPIPSTGQTEIRTERIFLSPAIEEKLRTAFPEAKPTLTYLVNTLAANGQETPYSMVTGADPTLADFLPDDLADDEIVLNSWQAEDLAAKAGDTLKLSYWILGSNNILVEDQAEFTVRAVVPLEGAVADKLWTPDFPGIAEAETNADWESGLPIDTTRIRDKDETYWDNHRATPKAFITHTAAARLWSNRWGAATALRLPPLDRGLQAAPEPQPSQTAAQPPSSPLSTSHFLLSTAALQPADAGFHLRDLASESQNAASSPVDIASLFLSMSFFLIIAAVALTALLFRFNIEQRNTESGLLSAIGIPPKTILRWRLIEGLVIITIGTLIGVLLALAYTRGLLLFLERIWNTSGERLFQFHAAPTSILGGVLGFILVMMLTIRVVTRRQGKRSASLRLTSGSEEIPATGGRKRPRLIAMISAVVAIASLAATSLLSPSTSFFLTGFALLVLGLSIWRASFQVLPIAQPQTDRGLQSAPPSKPPNNAAQPPNPSLSTSHFSLSTPAQLARTNLSRRPTRSLVAVGTLASAIFLVISVTAFQKHGTGEWQDPASGTGGYGLWIETSSALTRLPSGKFEFEDDALQQLLPIRVGAGDDASCFNLNTVARPRLLATDTATLEKQNAFTIKSTADDLKPTWSSLQTPRSGGLQPPTEPKQSPSTATQSPDSSLITDHSALGTPAQRAPLPAFIDFNTLTWVLKKKPGDLIEYTDEFGNPFRVLIAGTLTESVFQGSFIVDEKAYLERFPGSAGYRLFMAIPTKDPRDAQADLQQSLTDLGATVTPTADRLAAFHSVENTYISIFNVLGGLGVILGAAGLGLVTARNLAERKDEFAMLRTIGIPKAVTQRVIKREVRTLILAALVIGLIAAIVSILPSLPQQPNPSITLAWIAGLAGLTTICATLSAWIAYRTVRKTKTPA